jgi:hypothetical protein
LEIAENTRENFLSVLIIDKEVTIGQSYYLETLFIVFPDPENPMLPENPIKNETARIKKFCCLKTYFMSRLFFHEQKF